MLIEVDIGFACILLYVTSQKKKNLCQCEYTKGHTRNRNRWLCMKTIRQRNKKHSQVERKVFQRLYFTRSIKSIVIPLRLTIYHNIYLAKQIKSRITTYREALCQSKFRGCIHLQLTAINQAKHLQNGPVLLISQQLLSIQVPEPYNVHTTT